MNLYDKIYKDRAWNSEMISLDSNTDFMVTDLDRYTQETTK